MLKELYACMLKTLRKPHAVPYQLLSNCKKHKIVMICSKVSKFMRQFAFVLSMHRARFFLLVDYRNFFQIKGQGTEKKPSENDIFRAFFFL